MIIPNKQEKEAKLDPAMQNPKSTIMVLSGGPQSTRVHKYTQEPGKLEPWQVCFLIADLDALEDEEKDAWFGGANPEQYIVFGGEDSSQAVNGIKQVADQGPVSSLMLSDIEVDKLAVSDAFAKGDQL